MSYLRPGDLEQALTARRDHPDWVVLCGGTDVYVDAGLRAPPPGIIDVFGLPELVGIAQQGDGSISIGAATTYRDVLASDLLWRHTPIVCEAAREIGALQIQARGSIGGNIVTSSPVGDTLPVLLALDAELVIASTRGRRQVAYEAFCTGYRQTDLAGDELLLSIVVPEPRSGTRQFWRKVGTRRAQSISKVMIAAVGTLNAGVVKSARIALGAMADRPVRVRAAEQALIGRQPGPEVAAAIRAAISSELSPITDVRSTAEYRLHVAQNLGARFVSFLREV